MLKITVLSISLATVTGGAAVAPALGLIAKHFQNESELLIKLIITTPSLFIIISSLIFAKLARVMNAKSIAIIGFVLFIAGGVAPFFMDNIYEILLARAVLGLGTGFLMPLSVSLLGIFFPKSEHTKLMGLSAMCNQIGAVLTVGFSGFLAAISWQYSFLIYLFALFIFILNIIYLPACQISQKSNLIDKRNIKNLSGIYLNLFFMQVLFFNFTNNFSMIYEQENIINASFIGVIMGLNGLFGALASLNISRMLCKIGSNFKLLGALFSFFAFLLFSLRFSAPTQLFGIDLMLLIGISAAILTGLGLGFSLPFLFAQISTRSKKANLSTNMALASICIFSGQFLSPLIDEALMKVFNLSHPRDAFAIAAGLAFFLFIYNLRLKIKINLKKEKVWQKQKKLQQ